MCVSKDGRTTTQRKYKPIRREASRYGMIEKALRELKVESKPNGDGRTYVDPQVVAKRVKILTSYQVKSIMHFTFGVDHDKKLRKWYFTEEEIRVDAG